MFYCYNYYNYPSVAEGCQLDLTCVYIYGCELETLVLKPNVTTAKLFKAQCGYVRGNIYLFKSNNRNSRKRCRVGSNLTVKDVFLVRIC